mmetsp:Transcript_10106/g.19566  ORF Transcript_10106/g.19566 Transcript_10106/m.19566 type:complete len:164 (+) Transcript_10106:71-562(+)
MEAFWWCGGVRPPLLRPAFFVQLEVSAKLMNVQQRGRESEALENAGFCSQRLNLFVFFLPSILPCFLSISFTHSSSDRLSLQHFLPDSVCREAFVTCLLHLVGSESKTSSRAEEAISFLPSLEALEINGENKGAVAKAWQQLSEDKNFFLQQAKSMYQKMFGS